MLRLAERHKVPRKDFLDRYIGNELDEHWLDSIGGLDKKWKAFVENEGDSVDRIRTEIAEIAQQTGMALPEFRRKIGRAHVCTPVTNAHIVCRLLLEKKHTHN